MGFLKRIFRNRIAKLLILLIIFLILTVLSLEILSRKCPKNKSSGFPSCPYVEQKYVYEQMPSDLDDVIKERIIYVERAGIGGANGVACIDYGFVANDLPKQAKKYVATHEAIHLMGEINETATNYQAGRKEPLGLLQTVIYSFYIGIKKTPIEKLPCALGGLWRTFKVYF